VQENEPHPRSGLVSVAMLFDVTRVDVEAFLETIHADMDVQNV